MLAMPRCLQTVQIRHKQMQQDTEILTAEDPDYEDAADTTEDPVLDVSDDSADGDANASTDPADNTDSFYTAADGLVKISTEYKEQVHTGWYLFDENGYMVTGQAQVNPEQGTDIAATRQQMPAMEMPA